MTSSLHVWHLTPDAPRQPRRVSANEPVRIHVGTWPIAPGQSVWVTWRATQGTEAGTVHATWERNENSNSYWSVSMGPFQNGQSIEYTIHASDDTNEITAPTYTFRVGPKIYLALLWHEHQPLYRVTSTGPDSRRLKQPWVRLHALRDYYSMPALVAERPDVHVTFNLTPVLLSQIDDYTRRGATDRELELTLRPAGQLTSAEREEIIANFFDADWHHQIFIHRRYRELFDKRLRGEGFTTQDLQDLQMWSNLAWFGSEFRSGSVELITGERVNVHRFVAQGRDFSTADVRAMVAEQYKILRAVVPIYRMLKERGQIEVITSPFMHPILPLLIDTDQATIDLPGATFPRRFAHPEDAREQVRRAVVDYQRRFGSRPSGMWPPEGAVSQSSIPFYAEQRIQWIASDGGVLSRSGRWGYQADKPDVLCQPYLVRQDDDEVVIFFRDTALSDAIGFGYRDVPDPNDAVSQFLADIEQRLVAGFQGDGDRVVSVILDGENAWGAYTDDGRPFLRALYERLSKSVTMKTVTFSEYLHGDPERAVAPHPVTTRVYDLFTGSWSDEVRSRPGVDLGTWIGEPQENHAWDLLGAARDAVDAARDTGARALDQMYAAEGSDWFWWYGDDQDSGIDDVFDELFRDHLRGVYRELGVAPPGDLDIGLVPHRVVWSFAKPISRIITGDWLTFRTNCPGIISWHFDGGPEQSAAIRQVPGPLAGARRFEYSLGRIEPGIQRIIFHFQCTDATCGREELCCRGETHIIEVETSALRDSTSRTATDHTAS